MAWSGYFRYGDTEIINAARTQAYAEALGMAWVKETGSSPALGELLGESYTHPVLDDAPWYDNDEPASGDFAGIIPISVEGIEDSTRSSEVFEYTNDGGNPGSLRHSTKAVVFSVALVGTDECAVEYGFRWLKRALMRRNCQPSFPGVCRGENLYYASCIPGEYDRGGDGPDVGLYDGGTPGATGLDTVDGGDPTGGWDFEVDGGSPFGEVVPETPDVLWTQKYERHLINVLFNRGPVISNKKTLKGCNGVVWMVSFTAVAGDSFEYGNPLPILDGLGDGTDPFVAPYVGFYGSDTYTAAACAIPSFQPIYDPSFPALVAPPAPPNIAPAGFTVPTGLWQRRYADLPASLVPEWDEVRPIITVRSEDAARMLRVRFYPSYAETDDDCSDLVGEYIISYIPADVDLVIDTVLQAVYIWDPVTNITRRADSLIYGSNDARPIKWFGLSCGGGYRVTVDWDDDVTPVVDVSLSLTPRTA